MNIGSVCCESELSAHDQDVLNLICGFEPAAITSSTSSAASVNQVSNAVDSAPGNGNGAVSRTCEQLEKEAIEAVEAGNFQAAERLFTAVIELEPLRASIYNNRAQARSLAGDIKGAEVDIEAALSLSASQGSVACQAFTQRALVRRLQGDDAAAMSDFQLAAERGGDFAKSQLVTLNPFARLSSRTLAEMLLNVENSTASDEQR